MFPPMNLVSVPVRAFFVVAAAAAVLAGCASPSKIASEKPVRVLYLGDSLSDFDRGSNHVDRLQAKLDAIQPRYVSIYNYSIRGDYIERMMDRLHEKPKTYALDRYVGMWGVEYDWAFVFLGHNDTRAWSKTNFEKPEMSADQVRTLYTELIALLREKGIKRIILVSPASMNFELTQRNAEKALASLKKNKKDGNAVRYGEPRHVEGFCDVLRDVAKTANVEYLDLYTPMKALENKADYLRPTDGVHLSPKGHAWVADREFDYLTR